MHRYPSLQNTLENKQRVMTTTTTTKRTTCLNILLVILCGILISKTTASLNSPIIHYGEYPFNVTFVNGFELYWKVDYKQDTIELAIKSKAINGWSAIGIGHEEGNGMRHADCHMTYLSDDGKTVVVEDRYLNDIGQAPKLDIDLGGTYDILQSTGTIFEDYLHVKYVRRLNVSDIFDRNITDSVIRVSWAMRLNSKSLGYHSERGTTLINFLSDKPTPVHPKPPLFPFHYTVLGSIILLIIASGIIVTYTLRSHNLLYYYLFKRHTITTRFSKVNDVLRFTLGEITMILLYLVAATSWFVYELSKNKSLFPVGKALGHVNVLNLSLILLPVTRHSVWTWIFNISYERAIRFHRLLATSTLLSVTAHFIAMIIYYSQRSEGGRGVKDLFVWTMESKVNALAGFIVWSVLLIMAITALPVIRRKLWEVFQTFHFIGAVTIFVFAHIHVGLLLIIPYTACGIALYLADLFIRYLAFIGNRNFTAVWKHNLFASVRSCKIEAHQDIGVTSVTLTLDRKLLYNIPTGSKQSLLSNPVEVIKEELKRMCLGKYIHLWIWEVSAWQSHPFSITEVHMSDINTVHLSLNIKKMGYGIGVWTEALYDLARTGVTDVTARFDGPFGTLTVPLDQHKGPNNYDLILLFAAGIGITPIYGLADYCIKQNPNSHLTWVVPSPNHTKLFPDLPSISNNVTVFTTQSSDVEEGLFRVGRPNLESIVETHVNKLESGRHVAVAVCGTPSFISDVWKACDKVQQRTSTKFHIHTETFEL
jgi:ferric-chelate reductase